MNNSPINSIINSTMVVELADATSLRAKGLRKNLPVLQEVGSTHILLTQPVFRVV